MNVAHTNGKLLSITVHLCYAAVEWGRQSCWLYDD